MLLLTITEGEGTLGRAFRPSGWAALPLAVFHPSSVRIANLGFVLTFAPSLQSLYKHRFFDVVRSGLVAGHSHPSTMSAATLCGICVMVPLVPRAALLPVLEQVSGLAAPRCLVVLLHSTR